MWYIKNNNNCFDVFRSSGWTDFSVCNLWKIQGTGWKGSTGENNCWIIKYVIGEKKNEISIINEGKSNVASSLIAKFGVPAENLVNDDGSLKRLTEWNLDDVNQYWAD